MLGAEYLLNYENCPEADLFSLIFGNEAGGLEKSFLKVGQAIQIPQTAEVDSLNLAVAAAIGVYTFALKNKLIL
jgi:TrmH family RNA methyltransferase